MSRLRGLPILGLLALAGCGVEAETTSGAETDTVRDVLLAGETPQTVQLGGGRDQEHVLPPMLEITTGEWVRFVTLDRRVHTLSFVADSLSPEGREYLQSTGQMNSPALLERGTSFFVDFREAPEGRYVYSSRSHGEPAYGSVTVGRESTER